ncbi:hypothetical protein B0O80DRAFT_430897 [Mortierella sp. GBAus27b]|nr:hypothetical protein B0O80DRAFT_430897 [Mortierella sp. GBAus27b]
MIYTRRKNAPRVGQLLLFFLLSVLSVCISATIFSQDPNTIEIGLASKIPVGWLGIGTGGNPSGMTGNDLAICWPNPTGAGAIISQRAATRNGTPSVVSKTAAFTVQQSKSKVDPSTKAFTCTFSRPLSLSTSTIGSTASSFNVIFAIGLQTVQMGSSSDPQQATLQKHTYTGHGALTIVRKNGSSGASNATAPPSGGTPSSDNLDQLLANQRAYDKLVKAHGIMMAIAFLFLFPLGAFLVRFFSHIHRVFIWHRPIQITSFLLVIAAFVCILVAVGKLPGGPPNIGDTAHASFGVFLFTALILQVVIGNYIWYTFDPNRDPNKIHIPTWMHRIWGYAVLICGLGQVSMGIERYGEWTSHSAPVWVFYNVWVALLAVVFILGSIIKFVLGRRRRTANDKE